MLHLHTLLRVSLSSILRNRMRSLLTSLGIVIGVASVIVMTAIGQGAQQQILDDIGALGTNLLMVIPGASNMGGVSRGAGSVNRMTFDDVEALRDQGDLLLAVSPLVRSGGQVIGGGGNWSTSLYGVDPSYFTIRDWQVGSGRSFDEKDLRGRQKVAILGQTVVDELFPDQDPLGQRIRIGTTPYTVIGVMTEKGQNSMGQDQDDVVLAPSTTVLYRHKGGENIDMILASAIREDVMAEAELQIRSILREEHRLDEGEDDDFRVRNQAEFIEMASSTAQVLTLLLGSIAGVSLVVGGIGIMNIMLVSVTERTREIGLRMALGARALDVLVQFLAEAVVLSMIGGILGVAIALGSVALIENFSSLRAVIPLPVVGVAFGFAAAVGVFFGFYPARKASRLDPIDALRFE